MLTATLLGLLAAAIVLPWQVCAVSALLVASGVNRTLEDPQQSPVAWAALHALNFESDIASSGRSLLHRGSHRRGCASSIPLREA